MRVFCLMLMALCVCAFASAPAAQEVDVSNAIPGGGTPTSAMFDAQWTLGNGHTQVEVQFHLVRGDEVIASSGAFYYQSSGSDTFDIQFEGENVMVGDKIRMTGRFTGGGPPDPEYDDDITTVNAGT